MDSTYPKLYSRTSTGAIQEWQLFVEGDSFWCVYGQVDGKKITGAKTVCVGKNIGKANQTSPEEQAAKEAEAEFVKKKSQKDYFENINDIDNETFFSPQLAKKWEDYKDDIDLSTGEWCISPKLDGLRCVVQNRGSFSRNGKVFQSFPHIRRLLDSKFKDYPDLVVDSEIYQHSFKDNFNKIISLAKKTKPTLEDIAESEKLLECWIFDCGSMDTDFATRLEFIKWLVEEINDPRIKFVPHDIVRSEQEVEAKLAEHLSQGFEGSMLKNLKAKYQRKRTKDVLKYKLFQDQEFEILDIIEGIGGRSGKFGYAKLITDTGIEFDSNARGDEEFYKELLINKDQYISRMATVRYQNLTPDGKPRFPVIVAIRDGE